MGTNLSQNPVGKYLACSKIRRKNMYFTGTATDKQGNKLFRVNLFGNKAEFQSKHDSYIVTKVKCNITYLKKSDVKIEIR